MALSGNSIITIDNDDNNMNNDNDDDKLNNDNDDNKLNNDNGDDNMNNDNDDDKLNNDNVDNNKLNNNNNMDDTRQVEADIVQAGVSCVAGSHNNNNNNNNNNGNNNNLIYNNVNKNANNNMANNNNPLARAPKRVVYYGDGPAEEGPAEEEEEEEEEEEPAQSWTSYIVSILDRAGERLAYMLGITSPKYQYAIDEYYRRKREEEEDKGFAAREQAAWEEQIIIHKGMKDSKKGNDEIKDYKYAREATGTKQGNVGVKIIHGSKWLTKDSKYGSLSTKDKNNNKEGSKDTQYGIHGDASGGASKIAVISTSSVMINEKEMVGGGVCEGDGMMGGGGGLMGGGVLDVGDDNDANIGKYNCEGGDGGEKMSKLEEEVFAGGLVNEAFKGDAGKY